MKSSSEDRGSQESIGKNTDLMIEKSRGKNAIPEREHAHIGKNGRVIVTERNHSIPSKDKGGSR